MTVDRGQLQLRLQMVELLTQVPSRPEDLVPFVVKKVTSKGSWLSQIMKSCRVTKYPPTSGCRCDGGVSGGEPQLSTNINGSAY